MRRRHIVDRVRPAGEDDALVICRLYLLDRRGVGQYLGIDLVVAHAAGDELVILPAEVENENFFHISSQKLNVDLGLVAKLVGVALEHGRDALVKEVVGLLGGAADEVFGLEHGEDFVAGHAESGVGAYAVDEVVRLAVDLDSRGCGDGVPADPLVQLLTVAAALDGVHHNILGRHKGQLVAQVLLDDLRIDDEAVDDVDVERQDSVGREERLGHADALVRGVVERALEPLGRGGYRGVGRVTDDVARKRRDALGAHGIALVGHGRRADLTLFKRLFDLFEMSQQANVV